MSNLNLPSSCQSYAPNQDNSNAGNMGSQLLNSMGAQKSCDLTSFYAAVGGKVSEGPGGLLGSAEISAQMNGLKKSGCQVMAAVVGNFLNSIYQSRCVIENDSTQSTTTVTINQSANVEAVGAGSEVNCPDGIDINQSATVIAKVINDISTTTSNTIASVAQAGLANTAAQVGKIKDGYQGTSSGAKYLQTIQDKLIQASQSTSLKNAIAGVCNDYTVNQNGNVVAKSGGVVFSKNCTFTQNSYLDLQLANIISNAYSSDIKSAVSAFLTSKESQDTSTYSEGAPNVVGDMFKNNWMYIVGAVVAVILGIFLLKFMKSKNAAKMFEKATVSRAFL